MPFDGETVAMAHTAGLDADADLAVRRLGHVALDEFKRAAGPRQLSLPSPPPPVPSAQRLRLLADLGIDAG